MYSILQNTVVAVNTILLFVLYSGGAVPSQTKGLVAFIVTATLCFNASISS